MKNKIITLASVALILSALLSSCGKLVIKNDGMYNEKDKIEYSYAPMCYEAAGWEKEAYIKDKVGFEYHKVTTHDGKTNESKDFLYDDENKTLLYNSELTLPTLSELDPDELHFYIESSSAVHLSSESNKTIIQNAVEVCLTSPACTYPARDSDQVYRMKFYSSEHPYILYCLTYIEYSSDYYEYESASNLETHTFREGVEYEIITEDDGSYTVKYNYGKYFVYNRETGECRMAKYIHDTFNAS